MAKVYIATCWQNKPEAREAKALLEANGIEVTSHWIDYHNGTATQEGREAELNNPADMVELQTQALEDIADIIEADVFVIMNLGKSEGKATELGIAWAIEKPIVLVGDKTINIFYELPGIIQVATIDEAVEMIVDAFKEEVQGGSQGN